MPNLIAAGVPINAVSERLGHSETSTTMNIYVPTSLAMQQQLPTRRRYYGGVLSQIVFQA